MAKQSSPPNQGPQNDAPRRKRESEKQVRSRLLHFDLEVDLGKALLGGLMAALVSIAGSLAVGQVSEGEWKNLLEAVLPSARLLCVGAMTASATILALMLTALGVSRQSPAPLRSSHYKRVEQIALLDTATFVLSTLLLLGLTIPIGKSASLSPAGYSAAYYIVLVLSSLLGGMVVSVVLMIYGTIRDLVEVIGLEREDSPILFAESESPNQE